MFDPISAAVSGAIGVGIGWFAHKLARGRDRVTRLRLFLGFMGEWRSEVERSEALELASAFAQKVHRFRGEAAKVRDDFRDCGHFDILVQQLSSLTASQINFGAKPGRDIIAEQIDAIVQLTSKA